jgi:arylsulfatase A-like enzyme
MDQYRGRFLPESAYEGTDSGPDFRKHAYGSQPEAHAAFAAMVNVMDDDIGELVSRLDELGLGENTLILFSSDNGPHTEGGHDPAYFNSSGSRRGTKRDLYEGGIHVPLIARWPGRVPAGSETDHLSAFWDVYPTMAELVGQPVAGEMDGISFLPALLGKEGQKKHDYLYWEFHELQGRVALRQDHWKAVRYNVAVDAESPLELYDLSTDPAETTDIADQHPEVAARLDALIRNARTESPEHDFNFPLRRKKTRGGNAHK